MHRFGQFKKYMSEARSELDQSGLFGQFSVDLSYYSSACRGLLTII